MKSYETCVRLLCYMFFSLLCWSWPCTTFIDALSGADHLTFEGGAGGGVILKKKSCKGLSEEKSASSKNGLGLTLFKEQKCCRQMRRKKNILPSRFAEKKFCWPKITNPTPCAHRSPKFPLYFSSLFYFPPLPTIWTPGTGYTVAVFISSELTQHNGRGT